MTRRTPRTRVIELLGGDAEFFDKLRRYGIVPSDELTPEQVERVLVARTLVFELDVNLPGVEVVLRLRRELLETRIQMTRLADKLRSDQRIRSGSDE